MFYQVNPEVCKHPLLPAIFRHKSTVSY